MSNIGVYDNNQFAYRKASRNQAMAAAPRKLKRRLPIWMDILIILIVIGAASAAGFVLTHPSPHRSAVAVASNFVHQMGTADYKMAAADIDPADSARALSVLDSMNGLPGGAFADVQGATKLGTSNVTGQTATVVIQACNASLACNDLPTIPCVEINGKWYVSWIALIESTG
jgi:hypothetical protein